MHRVAPRHFVADCRLFSLHLMAAASTCVIIYTPMRSYSVIFHVLYLRQTVINDVTSKFENQSVEELAQQKIKIQDMLDSGKASVDSEFWEAVLKELHVFQVKRRCSLDFYPDM